MDFQFASHGLWSEKQNILLQHMLKNEFWILSNKCGNNLKHENEAEWPWLLKTVLVVTYLPERSIKVGLLKHLDSLSMNRFTASECTRLVTIVLGIFCISFSTFFTYISHILHSNSHCTSHACRIVLAIAYL